KMEELISVVKPMEGAVETLRFLDENGFKIHLITARHNKYNQITAQWLDEHNVPYVSLSYTDNKAPLALKKGVRLFVEDSSANARDLARVGINVILLDKYHNKDIEDYSRIIRVEDWSDIKTKISGYFQSK
ncbi:MAG: 5' nucleotidase, NT5C type, partial [Halanaerobiales bacterium]